jgi:hypothetical protein
MQIARNLLSFAAVVAIAPLTSAAVPSGINYQGRLTNAAGVPQAGNRTMNLKIYDAPTAGTLLYAESIGSIPVDANGVYGFQFGASGTSNTLVTETLAITDGTALTYQKTLSNTPAIIGTTSVTDGTYSWNEITGNPGSPAAATATIISGFVIGAAVTSGGSGYTSAPSVTIMGSGSGATATATVSSGAVSGITINSTGSGYTAGTTITIAPPPAPFIISTSAGTVTATYASAPAAGQTITTTYRYTASGISGALAAGAEQWLELAVDGIIQTPRQKVLTVPFAIRAAVADSVSTTDPTVAANIQDLNALIQRVNMTGIELPGHLSDSTSGNNIIGIKSSFVNTASKASWDNMTSRYLSKVNLMLPGGSGSGGAFEWALLVSNSIDAQITRVTGNLSGMSSYYNSAEIRIIYSDGTNSSLTQGAGDFDFRNIDPEKNVRKIEFYSGTSSSQTAGINVTKLQIYPVPNQDRYVDINLSNSSKIASHVSLVTNSFDQSKISYSVISGQWISEKLSVSLKHQIPQGTRITGLRIFLKYVPGNSDFSGADLQSYSLRIW